MGILSGNRHFNHYSFNGKASKGEEEKRQQKPAIVIHKVEDPERDEARITEETGKEKKTEHAKESLNLEKEPAGEEIKEEVHANEAVKSPEEAPPTDKPKEEAAKPSEEGSDIENPKATLPQEIELGEINIKPTLVEEKSANSAEEKKAEEEFSVDPFGEEQKVAAIEDKFIRGSPLLRLEIRNRMFNITPHLYSPTFQRPCERRDFSPARLKHQFLRPEIEVQAPRSSH